jgi:spore germination protein KC
MLKVTRLKIFLFSFFLTVTIPFLTGCWDSMEVEESAFVAVIGLDLNEHGGMDVTYLISNPQGGGFGSVLGSSQNEPPEEVITMKIPDILTGRDLLGTSVTRKTTFSHMRTMVVGEELARSGKLLSSLEAALRDREIRRDMFLIVCKEKAADFMNGNSSKLETRPHKFYEFIAQRWEETGLVPVSTVHMFMQSIEQQAGLFLDIYGTTQPTEPNEKGNEDEYLPGSIDITGGNPLQMIGSAVFKNGIMVGTLNGEETRFCQLLRPHYKIPSILTSYPDPIKKDYRISTRIIKEENTDIKIDTSQKFPVIHVSVSVFFDILAIPSGIDYISDSGMQKQLERHISNILSEKALKLVKKTQQELKGDPFLWFNEARKKFSTWGEYRQYNWAEKYPNATVSIQFEAKMRRVGKMKKPSEHIKEKED